MKLCLKYCCTDITLLIISFYLQFLQQLLQVRVVSSLDTLNIIYKAYIKYTVCLFLYIIIKLLFII